jgi:hypothetical protein
MPASTLGHPDRLINYDTKIKKWRTANTVFTSWLFLGLGKCILPTTFVLTESFSASMPPRGQHPTVSGQRQNSLTLLSLGLFWVASFLTQLKFFVPMEFLGFVPHSFTTNTAMGTNILDMCIIKSKIPLLETRSLRIKRVSSFHRFVRIMYPLPSCFHKRKMCNSVEIPGNIPRSKSSC